MWEKVHDLESYSRCVAQKKMHCVTHRCHPLFVYCLWSHTLCFGDEGEARKGLFQIFISLSGDHSLIGFLLVFRIDLIHVLHSTHNLANGTKALAIQKFVSMRIDKHLGRTRIGTRRGKCNGTSCIGFFDGIIFQCTLVLPFPLYLGIPIDPKLNHKIGKHSKESKKTNKKQRELVSVKTQNIPEIQ